MSATLPTLGYEAPVLVDAADLAADRSERVGVCCTGGSAAV